VTKEINCTELPAMARVGYWGNKLVRADIMESTSLAGDFARPWLKKKPPLEGKERRERENLECVGGLRSPWKGVAKEKSHRDTGELIKAVIVGFINEQSEIVDDLLELKEEGYLLHKDRIEKQLVPQVAMALGVSDVSRGPRSRWRAAIVEGYVRASGDQEVHLAGWLREGAPTGVACEIPSCGIFPEVTRTAEAAEDLQRTFAQAESHANYASVREHHGAVREELKRLTGCGFMTRMANWTELAKEFTNVVISKMACLVKEKEDGSVKLRLITDMLRSGINSFVKLHERIVLPRLFDLVEASLQMMESCETSADIEMMVSDFADAFHSMGVCEEERRHQVRLATSFTRRDEKPQELRQDQEARGATPGPGRISGRVFRGRWNLLRSLRSWLEWTTTTLCTSLSCSAEAAAR
jgi:hypothetical protein